MDGRFIIDNLLKKEKNERLDFLPKVTEFLHSYGKTSEEPKFLPFFLE